MRSIDPVALSQIQAALSLSDDPAMVQVGLRRARAIIEQMAFLPYNASRIYLPGLSMPATQIITVTGIPDVPAGTETPAVTLEINTPGVVVGILGASRPTNDATEAAFLSWQLTLEASYTMNTGANGTGFTSFAVFGDRHQWIPTMLPSRGSGGWSMKFANAAGAPATATPIFQLAFLQGTNASDWCRSARIDLGMV